MVTRTSGSLASIIIPCWNQLEFTRQCIGALRKHTRRPWELVVVDNGSTDGTADYLAGVSDIASVPVTVITNASNRGFPAAINQGLKAARGEYLVLLNNDVVVTDGWLGQLIALLNASRSSVARGPWSVVAEGSEETALSSLPTAGCLLPTAKPIGLSGHMSNYAAPPQLVENVPYRDLHEMHAFARKWRHEHRGKWFTAQ
jgi:GT2 family glycosyltransferase